MSLKKFLSSNYKEYEFAQDNGRTLFVEARNKKEALKEAQKLSKTSKLHLVEIYSWENVSARKMRKMS